MKFDKHGIAKIHKEQSQSLFGLISGFIGVAVGLNIGMEVIEKIGKQDEI